MAKDLLQAAPPPPTHKNPITDHLKSSHTHGTAAHLSLSISFSAEVLLVGLLMARDLDSPKSAILTKPVFWATARLPPSKGTPPIIRLAGFRSLWMTTFLLQGAGTAVKVVGP